MPQSVPNVLALPEPPRFKPAPPPQPQQPGESDGQSFKEALGRVKDRSASQPDDAQDKPAKADHKKPARPSKPTDLAREAPDPKTKTAKTKDQPTGQDAQSQSDDAGQQQPQDGHKQPKQQAPGSQPNASDSADVAQLAAVAQAQVPATAKPEANGLPKSERETSSPSKPAAAGRASPQPVRPAPQKEAGTAHQPNGSDDTAAPDTGDAETQQPDADQSAQGDPGHTPETTQVGQSKTAKPPLLAKQTAQGVPTADTDLSQQSAATPAAMTPIDPTMDDSADATQSALDALAAPKSTGKNAATGDDTSSAADQPDASRTKAPTSTFRVAAADPAPTAPPEAQFAEANHANIVGAIHGQLLPGGGSMHIRLDPPELGALNVRVEMRDGVMTAAFETTNDQATKLLSHSLGDLKAALEAQGVSVEKLHVRQSEQHQSSSDEGRQSARQQDSAAQREQQRRDLMRRMWRRLMKGEDPLDLVA